LALFKVLSFFSPCWRPLVERGAAKQVSRPAVVFAVSMTADFGCADL